MFVHPDLVNLFTGIVNIAGSSHYEDVILAAMPTFNTLVLHSVAVSEVFFSSSSSSSSFLIFLFVFLV